MSSLHRVLTKKLRNEQDFEMKHSWKYFFTLARFHVAVVYVSHGFQACPIIHRLFRDKPRAHFVTAATPPGARIPLPPTRICAID